VSYYAIFDNTANLVDSFDEEAEARHALEAIVRAGAESSDDYAMLTYDDDGHPVGPAVTASALRARVNIP
jgi:hypothetical protein